MTVILTPSVFLFRNAINGLDDSKRLYIGPDSITLNSVDASLTPLPFCPHALGFYTFWCDWASVWGSLTQAFAAGVHTLEFFSTFPFCWNKEWSRKLGPQRSTFCIGGQIVCAVNACVTSVGALFLVMVPQHHSSTIQHYIFSHVITFSPAFHYLDCL